MAILPDHMIQTLGPTLIEPFDPNDIQPASYDLHLDRYFYVGNHRPYDHVIDPSVPNDNYFQAMLTFEAKEPFPLEPGEFVLGSTYEKVHILEDLVARFEGKSSLGRLGLLTHVTAGFIDPGFSGHITVEIVNLTQSRCLLRPGMKIGQICFEKLTSSVMNMYGSKATGSHYGDAGERRGPTLSRSHINYSEIDVYEKKEVVNARD